MAEITNEQRKKIIKVELLETFAELVDIIKANKDVNSVEGNIAVFNNDGDPVDSNYSFLNIPILDANGKIPASQLNIVEGYLDSGVFYKVENIAIDYVEIGGLKWATKNVGASNITDTGLYFQWGDTQGYTAAQVGSGSGKKYFDWANYKYGNGTSSPGAAGMTKYNSTDGKTVLDLEDDGVRANWGGNWRMPTTDEFQALSAATTTAWTNSYEGSGVSGLVLTSKADSSKKLFFSAAGNASNGSVYGMGSRGLYWSSSLYSSNVVYCYCMRFDSSTVLWQNTDNRRGGFQLRGVWDGQGTPVISLTVQVTPESNTLYIDTTTNKIYRYNGSNYVEVSSAPTSLPASDVYNWAKAASKPSYTLDEVSDGSTRKLSDYPKKTIEITWANLKSARDNSQLVPGQWYRITDYATTTVQSNTQSAGHQFDIIVRADDVNKLNENAYAALHSGDTYFANSKLETWELKYCLDNINWSQSSAQENIVVHDSEGSDTTCYYDGTTTISNVTYYKWKCEGRKIFGYFEYALTTAKSSGITAYVISNNVANDYGCTVLSYSPAITDEGTGTITYMKDEYNNECPYDFKNIQFKVGVSSTAGTVANVFYYTFSVATGTNDATVTDHSLNGRYCYGNRMDKYFISGGTKLNFNVFRNTTVTINCCDNTFDNNCRNNVFGLGCHNNKFGMNCCNNTFGNNCYNNTLGSGCYNNTFGNYFNNNMFGQSCNSNTFGQNCYSNTFGQNCSYNTLGQNCNSNTFGQNCSRNTFAKDYSYYIIIENGNLYITLTSTQTTSVSNILRNIKICQGVNNTTTTKTISHNTVNDTFQTEYKPTNSQIISV